VFGQPSSPTPATGSVENATLATSSEVLIPRCQQREGSTDPDDPRIRERRGVLERIDAGMLSLKEGAIEMGVSYAWAPQLLAGHRAGRADPAVLKRQMLDRLATAEGRQTYAKRKSRPNRSSATSRPICAVDASRGAGCRRH